MKLPNALACVAATGLCLLSPASRAQSLPAVVADETPSLVETYKVLHAHPELSHHEEHTSALLAEALRKAGYTVTEHIGKYPDGSQAYGIVAILENGKGPRLLIRSDMDALPVIEETGLDYASRVRTRNASGQEVGVMHACGHDVHMTNLIGTARALAALKKQWHGTVMLIGQPSEETIDGAQAMLADNLYQRFGTPDLVIGLHDTNTRAAGTVAVTSGAAMAGSTSMDVIMRGIGGHGARPQEGKDPIVMAGEFIVQLQTIVSRQVNPGDPAVVTVGDIHGGTKRNIIPDEVKMELTTRYFSDAARQTIVEGVRHTAQGVALSAGVPADRSPIVTVQDKESTPVTYNDPALTARVKAALVKALGPRNVFDEDPIMASEDFGTFGLEGHRIPTVLFWLGAVEPAKYAAARAQGKLTAGLHTSRFAPDPELTLRTGVTAMTSVALSLLK
ncbi:MAG TPA: amidohydrolase [Steroidobacteraceae bacterium]|nr:amidohydrolase [Steroidobacteraceae bacterium]